MRRPANPIPSATVLLLRDGSFGLEVFMVTRNTGIDFAGGALVFPGGKIDSEDLALDSIGYCDGVKGLDLIEIGEKGMINLLNTLIVSCGCNFEKSELWAGYHTRIT